jgi:hypothetical protein
MNLMASISAIRDLGAEYLLVETEQRVNGLIPGAGGDILLGEDSEKLLEFSFTRQMRWNACQIVAISPEPGGVAALGRQRKVFASNHLCKPEHRLSGSYAIIVIYEQVVVY